MHNLFVVPNDFETTLAFSELGSAGLLATDAKETVVAAINEVLRKVDEEASRATGEEAVLRNRVDTLAGRLDTLVQDAPDLLDTLKEIVEAFQGSDAAILKELRDATGDLESLGGRTIVGAVAGLEATVAPLPGNISKNEEGIEGLQTSVSALEADLGKAKSDILSTQSTLTTTANTLDAKVEAEIERALERESIIEALGNTNKARIDSILANTTDEALDSLHEIAQAFQAADGSLAQSTQSLAAGIRADLGDMTGLDTQETTLVGAVNELTSALSRTASGATVVDLESRVAANEGSLATHAQALQAETGERTTEDHVLRGLITAEVSRAETRETAIEGRVSTAFVSIGDLEQLTTSAKTSLVDALNEVTDTAGNASAIDTNASNIASNAGAIAAEGTRAQNAEQVLRTSLNAVVADLGSATLTTTNATVREAINELKAAQGTLATQSAVHSLGTTVGSLDLSVKAMQTGKADQTTVNKLTETKADRDSVDSLTAVVEGLKTSKADNAAVESLEASVSSLQGDVGAKANQSTVDALSSTVTEVQGAVTGLSSSKAEKSVVNSLSSSMTTLQGTVTELSSSKADTTAVSALSSSMTMLQGTVADLSSSKAEKTAVNALSSSMATLQGTVTDLSSSKADTITVDTLSSSVTALQSTVSDLSSSKADRTAVDTLSSSMATLQSTATANGDDIVSLQQSVGDVGSVSFATSVAGALNHLHVKLNTGESVASLTIQIDELQDKVGSTSLSDDLTTSVGKLYTELSLLNTNMLSKAEQSNLSALQTTVAGLTTTVETKASKTDLNALQETVGTAQSDVSALQTDLGSLTKIVAEFQQSDSDLNTLIQNLGTTKAEKSVVDALITTVETKTAQSDFNALQETVGTAQSNVHTLQTDLAALETTLASKAASGDLAALDNKVNNIVSNLDPAALDSLTEIVSGFQQSDSDLNALIQNVGATKAEKSAVDALIAMVEAKASQSDLNALQGTVGTTRSDLDTLETTVSNLTTTVGTKALQSDLNALQGTVNTTRSDLDTLETTVSNLTTTVGTKALQSDLNALQGTVNTTQSDLDALETTVSNLTTTVGTKALQSDLNALQGTVGTTRSDLDTLETTVSNLTTTVGTKALQSDLNALQGTVNTTQSDLDALETTVSNLTTTVGTKAAQSQVDHIESQLGLSFSATYGNIKDAVVDIAYVDRSDSSTYVGTGWFYAYDGKQYIVTAAHVGQDYDTTGTTSSRYSNRIYATILNHNDTGKNVTVPCLPIAADSRADIMVLVPYDKLARVTHHKALAFGRSRDVTPGTTCMIVGNARGYDVGSCSTGVIRDNAFVFPQGVETMFVAAPAVGGNSGGPIVDVSGNVIGSLTFGFANEETLGGGVAQFMMEPIVKKLIVQGETLVADFPQYVSAVEANTHSTYENRKATFNGTAYRIQTSDVFLYFPGMLGVNPSVPRQGMMFSDVASPSPIQSNDVVYEITYTPNDATFDPNYNGETL